MRDADTQDLLIRERIETDEMGAPCVPLTRGAALAVLQNPFAGIDQEDLAALFEIGATLGERLASEIVAALGAAPVSYGKAAIVGALGASEHGAALLPPRLGKPVRQAIGGGKALMPSTVKVAATGTAVDLPLGHKDEAWSFDHTDTMSVAVPDAPRPNEILVCLAMSDGARPCARVGKVNGMPRIDETFHDGERAVQDRAGVPPGWRERVARAFRPAMTAQHQAFFENLPLLVLGLQDGQGRPWATVSPVAVGARATAAELSINGRLVLADRLGLDLRPGARAAVLGLDFESRRRNRMNGTIAAATERVLTVAAF